MSWLSDYIVFTYKLHKNIQNFFIFNHEHFEVLTFSLFFWSLLFIHFEYHVCVFWCYKIFLPDWTSNIKWNEPEDNIQCICFICLLAYLKSQLESHIRLTQGTETSCVGVYQKSVCKVTVPMVCTVGLFST